MPASIIIALFGVEMFIVRILWFKLRYLISIMPD
jgi:hypothetical protein